jgi:hypothetical protein
MPTRTSLGSCARDVASGRVAPSDLHERPLPAAREVERVLDRLVSDAQNGHAVDGQADEHAEVACLRQEIACAVQRVDDPDAALAEPRFVVGRLLAEDRVFRKAPRILSVRQTFAASSGRGDRRAVGLVVNRDVRVSIKLHDRRARFAGRHTGDFELAIEAVHGVRLSRLVYASPAPRCLERPFQR